MILGGVNNSETLFNLNLKNKKALTRKLLMPFKPLERKENLNLNFSRGKIITRFPDSYIPATIPIPLGARACLITSGGKY